MKQIKNYHYIVVIVLALCAMAAMLVVLLPRSSIWYDESYSATIIAHNPSEIVSLTQLDVHPPLYYLVLKLWAVAFGYQTVALRAFSAVCMLLAVLLLVRFLYRYISKRAAAVSACVLALGPYLLRYGVEIRMYGLGTLLSVLATIVLYHLVVPSSSISRKWLYFFYTLLGAALIYTQYFFVLLLLGHLVYLGIYHSGAGGFVRRVKALYKQYKGILIANGVVALLFLPWLPTCIEQVRHVQNGFWIRPVSAVSPLDSATHLLVLSPFDKVQAWSAVIFLLGLVVVVIAMKRAKSTLKMPERMFVRIGLVVMVTVAVVIFVCSLPPNQPLYHNRYLMTSSIFLYTAIAISLSKLPLRRYYAVYVITAILLLSGVSRAFAQGNNFDRSPDYFSSNVIGARLAHEFQPGDKVLSTGLWTYLDAYQYFNVDHPGTVVGDILIYQAGTQYQKQGPESVIYDRQSAMIRPNQLCNLLPSSGRLWIIDEPKSQIAKVPQAWLKSSKTIENQGYARLILVKLPFHYSYVATNCTMADNHL